MQPDRPGDELIQQESEDRLANSFTSKYNGNLLMVKRNCDVASDLHWYTWWSALKSRALFKPIRDKHTAVFARFAVATLPRTQTSLFRCARKGRRQRARRRFARRLYPSHGPLRFITSHSRFALASCMRKTKRLRRRLVATCVYFTF